MSWTNLDIPPSLIEDSQEELRRYRRENTPLRKARRARVWAEVKRRMEEHTWECPACQRQQRIDERERRIEVSE